MTIETDRLDALIAALLQPMPEGVMWNYAVTRSDDGDCGCALLVAALLWPDHAELFLSGQSSTNIGAFFGLSREEADDAFYFCEMDIATKDVTPRHVATALQKMRNTANADKATGSL